MLCSAAAQEKPPWWEERAALYPLASPESSFVLAQSYPRQEVRLDLILTYSKPGVVLDTCGINAAPPGSFTLVVLDDGRLSFSIYDPDRKSEVNRSGGWHQFVSHNALQAGEPYWVNIALHKGQVGFWIDEQAQAEVALATPLSGEPVYVGDFPGDDNWGDAYRIHPAMTGAVEAVYFGPYAKTLDARLLALTAVLPGVLVTTQADTADWDVPSGALDGWDIQNDPGASSNSNANQDVSATNSNPAAPEGVLQAFVEAQAREDLAAAERLVAFELFDAAGQAAGRRLLARVAGLVDVRGLQYQPLATMYNAARDAAVVRYSTTAEYGTAEGATHASFGGMCYMRQLGASWKIVLIEPDDLLNMEFIQREERGVARGGDPRQIGFMQSLESAWPKSELINYADLNQRINKAMFKLTLDTRKIALDESFSLFGLVPLVGDVVSNSYTVFDMTCTVVNDLVPDLYNMDMELVNMDIQQLNTGAISIISEAVPGWDVAADQMYQTLDHIRLNVRQMRAYTRLRAMVGYAALGDLPKYLILRPHINDPAADQPRIGNPPVRAEFYDTWLSGQRPLKSIAFISDWPHAVWKVLDFDIATQITISASECQALFDAALQLGLRSKAQAGLFPDFVVSIPVRLAAYSARGPLVRGEMDLAKFNQYLESGQLPPDMPLQLTSRGTLVLRNARLVTGKAPSERFLRCDITSAPGPVQVLQVALSDGSLTEPVTIENAVYNDLLGLEMQLPNGDMWFNPKLELGSSGWKPLEGQEASGLYVFTAHNPNLPGPRILGLPNLQLSVMDPSMISLRVSGQFPNAKLEITGLKIGTTEIKYVLATGDLQRQGSVENYIEVEVKSVGEGINVPIEVSTAGDPEVIVPPPPE